MTLMNIWDIYDFDEHLGYFSTIFIKIKITYDFFSKTIKYNSK